MRLPLAFLCCVASLCISTAASAAAPDGKLHIYWIDTEGGAATLIVSPSGESLLVDTGNPGRRDADRIVRTATQEAGLKRIDHLVTTHYHRDHFGGASMLSTLIPIGHVHDNGKFEGMPDQPDPDYWTFKCDKRTVLNPGDEISLSGNGKGPAPKLLCLGTRKQFIKPELVGARDNRAIGEKSRAKERDGSDNANSIVLLLSFGDFRFFDAGDLTWNQERELVTPYDLIGPVDVYQVTHHGLDASNNPIVIETVKPTVAIMNNGHTKGCAPDVFADLSASPSVKALYQVHKNLRPDGNKNNAADDHIANLEAPEQCQGHPIHLSVSSDGSSYTVEVASRKHSASFQTTSKK